MNEVTVEGVGIDLVPSYFSLFILHNSLLTPAEGAIQSF